MRFAQDNTHDYRVVSLARAASKHTNIGRIAACFLVAVIGLSSLQRAYAAETEKVGNAAVQQSIGTHTIQPGDTFESISLQYNVSPTELAKVNPRVNSRNMRPGFILKIPKEGLPIKNFSFITDAEFTDFNAMSQEDIQKFLEAHNSFLSKIYEGTYPSQWIYYAAKKHGINPILILTKLECEYNLISNPSPSKNRINWAGGVGVYDNGRRNNDFKGLYKQIVGIASELRRYLDLAGKSSSLKLFVDGGRIVAIAENRATFALLVYTPWERGNIILIRKFEELKTEVNEKRFEVPQGTMPYFVKKGESLEKISKRLKKELNRTESFVQIVEEIKRLNRLKDDRLSTNQRLLLPIK